MLPFEIEKWDTSLQEASIWVKVPQIDANSSSDYMYLYYGNPRALNGQSTINVWDSSYKGVWHLKENPAGTAPQAKDSSATANHATSEGGMSILNKVTGKIGDAYYFDNTDDRLRVLTPQSDIYKFAVNQNFSVSAWIKTATPNNYWWQVVGNQSANNRVGWYLMVSDPFANARGFFAVGNTCCPGAYGSTRIDDSQWHFLYGVREGSVAYMYIDGNLEGTRNSGVNVTLAASHEFYIGKDPNNYFGYNGIIDEVRVADTARSAAWIAAEYKTQSNSFINFGSEQINRPSSSSSSSGNTSTNKSLECTQTKPVSKPDLFQINTTKDTATLYFTPVSKPVSAYQISYGYDDKVERFGTSFSPTGNDGVQTYTINSLSPNTAYFFKVRASNGCMPGDWSREMIAKTGRNNYGFIYYAYSTIVASINNILR